ncbi:MAG TPA: hypothetical protein P5048_00845 [Chlamydiales bacterium]|nr:hypothetical protein [Chlamydiales bacterium]
MKSKIIKIISFLLLGCGLIFGKQIFANTPSQEVINNVQQEQVIHPTYKAITGPEEVMMHFPKNPTDLHDKAIDKKIYNGAFLQFSDNEMMKYTVKQNVEDYSIEQLMNNSLKDLQKASYHIDKAIVVKNTQYPTAIIQYEHNGMQYTKQIVLTPYNEYEFSACRDLASNNQAVFDQFFKSIQIKDLY